MTDTEGLVERRLTPEFAAMNGRDKWETLVLNGLIGTDEPWIEALTTTLRAEASRIALLEAENERLKQEIRACPKCKFDPDAALTPYKEGRS